MEAPFEQLLDRLEPPVTALIADTHVMCAFVVGNRRNIPAASLWPMSATMFSVFHHFDLLIQNQHYPVDLSKGARSEWATFLEFLQRAYLIFRQSSPATARES
ncbi:unnamed protein product, partial [Vitis vinifera]